MLLMKTQLFIVFSIYRESSMYTTITFLNFFVITLISIIHGLPVDTHEYIIGGTDAPIGKYPHHVALKYQGGFVCGGSIISKRYVLTAAHCIKSVPDPKKIEVHAGTVYLNETGDIYHTENVVWHSAYDSRILNDDIGLIRLNQDIVWSDVVKPITLAREDFAVENFPCVLSGWGIIQLEGPTPNRLQEIALKVFSPVKCKLSSSLVTDNHICTLTKKGEGVCFGDSGSALVANGIQIGIVSFVTPCALGVPDKFIKVSAYQDWIKKHGGS
ncbi:chymotrypsin-1-like [Linepithema humile]|uniref:chymotrypsin-1-like n=1 Tax=Linepithema humile TaxID=83485 RepID=UPI00351F0766